MKTNLFTDEELLVIRFVLELNLVDFRYRHPQAQNDDLIKETINKVKLIIEKIDDYIIGKAKEKEES